MRDARRINGLLSAFGNYLPPLAQISHTRFLISRVTKEHFEDE
jgi:hypothetical protein